MERFVQRTLLFDFYGELLTEHQRQTYEDVVCNDLSCSEVAAEQGVSRQGIHDLIKRCDRQLEEYESKLHLVARFLDIQAKVRKVRHAANGLVAPDQRETIRNMIRLCDEILEEL